MHAQFGSNMSSACRGASVEQGAALTPPTKDVHSPQSNPQQGPPSLNLDSLTPQLSLAKRTIDKATVGQITPLKLQEQRNSVSEIGVEEKMRICALDQQSFQRPLSAQDEAVELDDVAYMRQFGLLLPKDGGAIQALPKPKKTVTQLQQYPDFNDDFIAYEARKSSFRLGYLTAEQIGVLSHSGFYYLEGQFSAKCFNCGVDFRIDGDWESAYLLKSHLYFSYYANDAFCSFTVEHALCTDICTQIKDAVLKPQVYWPLPASYHFDIHEKQQAPDMRHMNARIQSFESSDFFWRNADFNPKDMAGAGFYYAGFSDVSICFSCDLHLCDWGAYHQAYCMDKETGQKTLKSFVDPSGWHYLIDNRCEHLRTLLTLDAFDSTEEYVAAKEFRRNMAGLNTLSPDFLVRKYYHSAQQIDPMPSAQRKMKLLQEQKKNSDFLQSISTQLTQKESVCIRELEKIKSNLSAQKFQTVRGFVHGLEENIKVAVKEKSYLPFFLKAKLSTADGVVLLEYMMQAYDKYQFGTEAEEDGQLIDFLVDHFFSQKLL